MIYAAVLFRSLITYNYVSIAAQQTDAAMLIFVIAIILHKGRARTIHVQYYKYDVQCTYFLYTFNLYNDMNYNLIISYIYCLIIYNCDWCILVTSLYIAGTGFSNFETKIFFCTLLMRPQSSKRPSAVEKNICI